MRQTLRHLRAIGLGLLLSVAALPGLAQNKPKLLVLGSAHFANPGNDQINPEIPDLMTAERQAQIEALVDRLAAFRPTKIAVEFTPRYQAAADRRYQGHLDGTYQLDKGEYDQIGIRLAARLRLGRVHAVDWNGALPGEASDYDWHSYGRTNGHEALLAAIVDPERSRGFLPVLRDQSVTEWLREMNRPEALARSHALYFDIAKVGDGDDLVGATWVGTWYARNLKIFGRLAELAESPDDRVLVIFGQGHAYLLQQFARESGLFEVVSVESVLAPDGGL